MARLGLTKGRIITVLIVVVWIVSWEYAPQIPWVKKNVLWAQPFFISSPSRILAKFNLIGIMGQAALPPIGQTAYLWPSFFSTLQAALLGFIGGVTLGLVAGVVLSQSRTAEDALRPYLLFYNSMPKIVIIPIIIILLGPGQLSKVVVSISTVFFTVFFNVFEGSKNLDPDIRTAYQVLGGSRLDLFLNVEVPNAVSWTLASLPNAMSHALVVVLTAEILGGIPGLGFILFTGTELFLSDTTFVVILLTGAVGATLVIGLSILKKKAFPWLPQFRD
jgi:NitT/TauT family transport system permease protein